MATFNAEKEKRKLENIIKNIPKDKKKFVEGLIADASFMAEQLERLRACIDQDGWAETYQNGANQYGRKASVEAEMYIKMQKVYQSVIRQLADFLPKDNTPERDEFLEFVMGR